MDDVRMVAVDGRDALVYVIIRPDPDLPEGVTVEAGANGMSKQAAAWCLRQIAAKWEAPTN